MCGKGELATFPVKSKKKLCENLYEISGYMFSTYEDSKMLFLYKDWHNSSVHIAKLSLLYPDVLFRYYYRDEHSQYVIYAKNGKHYRQEIPIVIPEFDETKL